MRIAFFGTPEFAVPSLKALVNAGHEVVLVVAQPDRPAGRGQEMQAPPVAMAAKELGLPLVQPKAIKTGAFPEQLTACQPEVAVVVAYGRILTRQHLETPTYGCINVHASLLPRWRGAAPIQWAVWAGDEVTGVCTQQMQEGLDIGPVFVEKRTSIGAHETASELHDRLSVLGAASIVETLPLLGKAVPREQDESLATYAGKIDKEMGRVDWSRAAAEIDRQVRAMTRWPGGFVPWADGALKLLEVRPVDGKGAPGEVLGVSPLRIACGQGALELVRVQAPGRKPLSGQDFANGARVVPGMRW